MTYSGTLTQSLTPISDQAGEIAQDSALVYQKRITLKALTSERAVYRKNTVDAQWIEIKVEIGLDRGGEFERSVIGGLYHYKLLLPKQIVVKNLADLEAGAKTGAAPCSIPVIRGYRQLDQQPVKDFHPDQFQIYPVVALLPCVASDGGAAESEALTRNSDGQLPALKKTEKSISETNLSQSTCEAIVTLSPDSPFRVIDWDSTLQVRVKAGKNSESSSVLVSSQIESMRITGQGTDAVAELAGE